VDPQALNAVNQVPEPLSPTYQNRVLKLSTRNRSHSVKYEPDSYSTACAHPWPTMSAGFEHPDDQQDR